MKPRVRDVVAALILAAVLVGLVVGIVLYASSGGGLPTY